jgi:hypothetical protein
MPRIMAVWFLTVLLLQLQRYPSSFKLACLFIQGI